MFDSHGIHSDAYCVPAFTGKNNLEAAIFPQDKVFKVGSTVTFCCILPAGTRLNRMYLDGYNAADMNTTKINNQTYALTVHLNQSSQASCTNVYCETDTSNNGNCAYIDCKYKSVLC